MSTQKLHESYLNADEATLELLLREASDRIASQVELLVATDTRSLGLLSVSATLATAATAIFADKLGVAGAQPLANAALSAAILLVLSAAFAAWALRPVSVAVRGWDPELFTDDIAQRKTAAQIRAEMLYHLQQRISTNVQVAKFNARSVRISMFFLALAPVVALIAAGVSANS
ncbi:MAG: hypothetical protein IV086_00600 [Hyphomonadaceae bacterium]|nr:hypothetical protein [Hyphomonadaceae bacterium]